MIPSDFGSNPSLLSTFFDFPFIITEGKRPKSESYTDFIILDFVGSMVLLGYASDGALTGTPGCGIMIGRACRGVCLIILHFWLSKWTKGKEEIIFDVYSVRRIS